MARPKKEFNLARERRFTLRLRKIEYERLCTQADNAGLTPSEYLRRLLREEKVNVHYNVVADIKEIHHLITQFFRIGNNLNQIATYYNTGGMPSRAMQTELNRCVTELWAMRSEVAEMAGEYCGNLKTYRK